LINVHPDLVKLNNIYSNDEDSVLKRNLPKEKFIEKKKFGNIVMDSTFNIQRFSESKKSV